VAKDKGQKRREREKKVKQERLHQEQKNGLEVDNKKRESSLKLYLIIIMVCLAGFFIFYNMK
jgi:hypothetical protein